MCALLPVAFCMPVNEQGGAGKLKDSQSWATLLYGTNVRLNWNIESDMNVYWI